MIRLDPPFLEIGFYFRDTPEADAFARLITALQGLGATFTGEAAAYRGAGAREKPFASPTDELPEDLVLDPASLARALGDPDLRLVEVHMRDAIGIARQAAEVAAYLAISAEAVGRDRHPLEIVTEAAAFEPPYWPVERRKHAGRRVYERFRALVEAMRPTYAALTIEFPLECPTDLRRDHRSFAFQDFFVSRSYLGERNVRIVERLFSGAFVEPLGDGLYVFSHPDLSPDGKGLDPEHSARQSVEVAKLVAGLC